MDVWSQPDNMLPKVWLILAFVLMLTCTPAAAFWTNEITLQENGMVWKYTDVYDKNESILFRATVDAVFGNNDSYVSAWELMKVDANTRQHFRTSLAKRMDVSKDGSSTDIHPVEFNAFIDRGLLGNIYKKGSLTNTYKVTYAFDKPLLESPGNLSFIGEPRTELNVSFPGGTYINSTRGIENMTVLNNANVTSVKGRFDATGIAGIDFL